MAIGGLGIALPPAQGPSPNLPLNFAQPTISNQFDLPAGGMYQIPPGGWMIQPGLYSTVVFRDIYTGLFLPVGGTTVTPWVTVNSDGANFFVFNPKGFPVSATVTAAGSAYVQSSTTVTASARGSLWHAIVGGSVGAVVIGVDSKGNTGGANFTLPPTIVISPPPTSLAGLPSTATASGGVPATAYCTISAGAINAVTIDIAGAGYLSAPTFQVIPNPMDPNIGIITVPVLTAPLAGAGTVTAVILDFIGTASGAAPTLTIAGAGTSATATANIVATAAQDHIIMQQIPTGI